MNLLLFGAPGVGKGTQSVKLTQKYGMQHISTGNLFRKHLKQSSPWSRKAKEYMDAGQYVPDDMVLELFHEVFEALDFTKGFVLDGFPRTIKQAEGLSQLLVKKDIHLDKAILLNIPYEILMTRLTGRRICKICQAVFHIDSKPSTTDDVCCHCGGILFQRSDDSEDVVKERLEVYIKNTMPLMNYYQKKGIFLELDGQGSEDEVFARIEALFKKWVE